MSPQIEAAYREMAKDEERERAAIEWSDAVIGDVAGDQPGADNPGVCVGAAN